jgi:hypothetical protein
LAALAGTAVYGVVFLLVLLIAADLFGWALTGGVVTAAWLLLLHAVTAGAALLIGWLGYRWARSLTPSGIEAAPPPARAAHYTALGILAGTTLLAIALLAATLEGLVGVAVVLLLAFVLWPLRVYVPPAIRWASVRYSRLRSPIVRIEHAFFSCSRRICLLFLIIPLTLIPRSHFCERLSRRTEWPGAMKRQDSQALPFLATHRSRPGARITLPPPGHWSDLGGIDPFR